MRPHIRSVVFPLAIAMLLVGVGVSAAAQDKPHVVLLSELNKDSVRAAQTRSSDESAVRTLFSSQQGQKVLQSVHFDYQKLDKAIGQLSDEEVASLAQRSRQVQADFAAGRISNSLIVVIIAVVAALIILAVSLPKD